MTLARRLAFCLLALVPVSAALAQPKPALVQNRDEPGRSPYVEAAQVFPSSSKCNLSACGYDFAVVPAGKRLVVTHVSVTMAQTGAGALAYLMRDGTDVMPLGVMQRAGNRFVLSAPVTYFVEPGQTPRIETAGDTIDTTGFLAVALVGYFVSLP